MGCGETDWLNAAAVGGSNLIGEWISVFLSRGRTLVQLFLSNTVFSDSLLPTVFVNFCICVKAAQNWWK